MFFVLLGSLVFLFLVLFFWKVKKDTWTLEERCYLLGNSSKEIKILHLSDLHLNVKTTPWFLDLIKKKIENTPPDLILFSGDFLIGGSLKDREESFLRDFLSAMRAYAPCYAVWGNHDYFPSIHIDSEGVYGGGSSRKSWQRIKDLFFLLRKGLVKAWSLNLKNCVINPRLKEILNEERWIVLENEVASFYHGDKKIVICGVLEYMSGRLEIPAFSLEEGEKAILLIHNPDGIRGVDVAPFSVIFSGHTHGIQVNIPFLRSVFSLTEEVYVPQAYKMVGKTPLIVSNGLSGTVPWRFGSRPEIIKIKIDLR